jgi:hypothetical protein
VDDRSAIALVDVTPLESERPLEEVDRRAGVLVLENWIDALPSLDGTRRRVGCLGRK